MKRIAWSTVAVAVLPLLSAGVRSDVAPTVGAPSLDQITVEARRERAALERAVSGYVSAIAVAPFQESLARWRIPVCPLVAGLPREHGEFILNRVSQIAREAGVPLASEHCRGNFYVVVTSNPDALLKAWMKRDGSMFGDAGGTKIRGFLKAASPVRVWYNANLETAEGLPLTGNGNSLAPMRSTAQPLKDVPTNSHALGFRLAHDDVRDLTSVIVLIDTERAKGISFGQLADYVALIGLAELRLDAAVGDAPTILNLFGGSGKAPPGLSPWDESFLKALYHTEQADTMQLSEIKISIVRDVAP
jgi:hypothetical protein